MRYTSFSLAEKEQAKQTDLATFLQAQGETLRRSGSEYEWISGGEKVTIRGNLWFHHYEHIGGDAIAFVQKFYDKNYVEAVGFLLSGNNQQIIGSIPDRQAKQFTPPEPNDTMRRVFGYLVHQRGLDRDIIHAFVHRKMIYESKQYHNVVFVGFDNVGNPRHVHKRSTAKEGIFKSNEKGSVPEFSFHWHGTSDKLFLFEAPIDMLSYIYMNPDGWRKHSYAAACSVSDRVLFQCLQDNENIKQIYICFDNDEAGQQAAKRISDKLFVQGIPSEILIPELKDWNEDLLFLKEQEEQCQAIQL